MQSVKKYSTAVLSSIKQRDETTWAFFADDGSRFAENSKYLYLECEHNPAIRNVWITTNDKINNKLENKGYESYKLNSRPGKKVLQECGAVFYTHNPIGVEYITGAKIIDLTHGIYFKKHAYDIMDKKRRRVTTYKRKIGSVLGSDSYHVTTSGGVPSLIIKSSLKPTDSNILVTGFPRNDVLYREIPGSEIGINSELLNRLKKRDKKQTNIFWTPTKRSAFDGPRGPSSAGESFDQIVFDLSEVNTVLERNNSHLYISVHPHNEFKQDIGSYDNLSIIDTGGDLYPFLNYCDILITDYSSIFYDYLLLDRPIIFYAPDLDRFKETARGFYFDYNSHVPGPIVRSPEELSNTIETVIENPKTHAEHRKVLSSEIHKYQDGDSSRRVIESVNEVL